MDENLDRILSSEQDVVPSSAFVRTVMVAVRHEASTKGPIPFPWRRALPGLAICTVALSALLVVTIIQFRGSAVGLVPLVFVKVVENANRIGLEWIALGLVASFVPTRLVLANLMRSF